MHTSSKPLIGITCGEIQNNVDPWTSLVQGQSQTFVDSVIRAGGIPILLPLTEDADILRSLCDMLDGLYMAGGNDLNPKLYGQDALPVTNDFSDLRDSTERTLLIRALETKKPLLCICRGMQLVNVHFGGTLHQDLYTAFPGLDHNLSNVKKSLVDVSHTITLQPGSKLAHIVGEGSIGANAHHHQAIDKLGTGVAAVGWADDGVIEAIEMPDYPYMVGIQAHPESLTTVEPRWQKLFMSFIAAAARK